MKNIISAKFQYIGEITMKKTIENHIRDIENELNARYTLAGYTPEGFEDNMYSIKLGILAEMYEVEEATGKLTPERDTAYGKIAEHLENMDNWN
jgi:NTP pyrophosphatase (non-canonical NTP hydrolase)